MTEACIVSRCGCCAGYICLTHGRDAEDCEAEGENVQGRYGDDEDEWVAVGARCDACGEPGCRGSCIYYRPAAAGASDD